MGEREVERRLRADAEAFHEETAGVDDAAFVERTLDVLGAGAGPGITDGLDPVASARARRRGSKPGRSRRRQARGEERPLTNAAQVRFVYEGGLLGEWFRVVEALDVPVHPHPEHTVVRLEFRDNPGSE